MLPLAQALMCLCFLLSKAFGTQARVLQGSALVYIHTGKLQEQLRDLGGTSILHFNFILSNVSINLCFDSEQHISTSTDQTDINLL